MIAGAVAGFIGVIAFSLVAGDIMDYFDPREVSEHSAENGHVNEMNLTSGCWVVNVEGDDSEYEVNFQYVDWEKGSISGDVDDDCRTDWQPMGSDVEFSTITKLHIEEDSVVLVTIECKPGDDNEYDGGDLHFASCNLTLRPKIGDVVISPSNWMFFHKVNEITSGVRYSGTYWYYYGSDKKVAKRASHDDNFLK